MTTAGAVRDRSQRRRLLVLLALNLVMVVGLVAVGSTAHSLGVVAAAGDYLADSVAIALGFLAVAARARRGEASRAPALVAALNAAVLLAGSLVVATEGARRLLDGTPRVHGLPVLLVSAAATAVMLLGVLVLGTGAGREDLHMRAVLLDTAADAGASAAVAVSGAVIEVTGRLQWLDSLLSVLIALLVGLVAARLLRDAARALRRGTPLDLDDEGGAEPSLGTVRREP